MARELKRFAAIADIHSNIAALKATLADIERRGCKTIVNLGDIVSGPLHPRETADLLMSLNLPTVRGNHERQLATLDPAAMGPSDRFAYDVMTEAQRRWIAGLPVSIEIGVDILLLHGGPKDDLAYLLETVTPSGCRPATEAEVEQRLAGVEHPLILCGHTHLPREMRLRDGRFIVNPGSVGLPAYEEVSPYLHRNETGAPHARYAILEKTADGWRAEFVQVAYDWAAASALAGARGRLDWAGALLTGRASP